MKSILTVLCVVTSVALELSPILALAQEPHTLAQYENLNSKKRYRFEMTKRLNGKVIEENEDVVQCLGKSHGENLYKFIFETNSNHGRYSLVYFQKIAGNQSFTYGYWDPSTDDIEIEPEPYIDLQGPIEVGTTWKFDVRYPGQPMVIDHPDELRYSFSASISRTGESFNIGGFHFEDCIQVDHRGVSDLEFSVTCNGKKIEHAKVIQTFERTYCFGHGPVFEKAEQFLESEGKRLTECDTFTYESPLTKIEDVPSSEM